MQLAYVLDVGLSRINFSMGFAAWAAGLYKLLHGNAGLSGGKGGSLQYAEDVGG